MYKLIACDMDETLLNDDHEIAQNNIDAIKKASQMGVKFVPATGRGYTAIITILKALDLYDKEQEYVISFNGCALTENKNNTILQFHGLDFKKAKQLFAFGLNKNVCIQIYTAETVYMHNANDFERNRYRGLKNDFVEIEEPSIEFLCDTPISKMIYQNVDIPYLKSFEHEMSEMVTGHVSVTYSSGRYMELNRLGVNKGNTMLMLADYLGIKQEETMAVGDNYNDQSMLEVAGLSVAAGNAVEEIKNLCDYVAQNNNNQGVLAEVIEKFILS